jgi:hypothetical protein
MTRKQKRRYQLLDDLLDYALRSGCQWALCNGPKAPIRKQQTCWRCACIHRAIQMGLVQVNNNKYIKASGTCVDAGVFEQFSVLDGSPL